MHKRSKPGLLEKISSFIGGFFNPSRVKHPIDQELSLQIDRVIDSTLNPEPPGYLPARTFAQVVSNGLSSHYTGLNGNPSDVSLQYACQDMKLASQHGYGLSLNSSELDLLASMAEKISSELRQKKFAENLSDSEMTQACEKMARSVLERIKNLEPGQRLLLCGG